MSDAFIVFLTGIIGVFIGMAFLYVTIKLNMKIVGLLEKLRESK